MKRFRHEVSPATLLAVASPRLEFILTVQKHFPDRNPTGIHSTARVAEGVRMGEGVAVGPYAVIECGAEIGPGCRIGAGAIIAGCVRLGARTMVDAGAVLGSDGFGFERDLDGCLQRFPQRGRVIVGDDVEIGSRVCINRGALSDTSIDEGTKIDDGAYVAHNVHIGPHCLIMAGVLVCGSVIIDEGAELSPGCIIRDRCRVGSAARVGLGAVVVDGVADRQTVVGIPARPLKQVTSN